MSVKVTTDRTKSIMAAIKALARDRVLIGIPAENAEREPDPQDPHPDLNNAEIGYLNEFGAPEINLPARPHLVPGVKAALGSIEKLYRDTAVKVLNGTTGAVDDGETKIGITAASAVKNLITAQIAPGLSERTIAARQARGRSGTTPLIDTGQYRNAITFAIKPAKDVKARS